MIYDLRALRLVIFMLVVLGTAGSSPAMAQQCVLTSDGPVGLNMTQTGKVGSGANALTAFGNKVECPASTYTGSKYNVTPHESIEEEGASTVTIVPTYANCFSEASEIAFSTTIDMNGCDYVLQIEEATENEDSYGVTTDIVCPEGKKIQVTVFNGHMHGFLICTLATKPQSGLSGVDLISNTASDDLTLIGTAEGVHVEQSGICGAETTTEGEIDTHLTVKGKGAEGPTGVTVVEADSPEQGRLTADGPVTLDMTENGGGASNAWTGFGLSFGCPGSVYTGHRYGSTPHEAIGPSATRFTVTPHYKQEKCSYGGFPMTMEMNGCDYALHIGGGVSANTFPVSTDVVCPAGKFIQMKVFLSGAESVVWCTLVIEQQSSIDGPHAVAAESGDFTIEGSFSGIEASSSGLCGVSSSSMSIDVDFTVVGKNESAEATEVTLTT